MKVKKMLSTIFTYLIIAYLALILLAYFFSDELMFPAPYAHYQDTSQIIKLKTRDNTVISAIYLPQKSAKYTILFSHGNAEDLGTKMHFLKDLQEHGFAVFAYDYHGYGTSKGKPNEQNTYNDIDAAYDYLITTLKLSPQKIIAYGYSIGSGPTVDLASREPVAGVILEAPFVSAFRVLTHYKLLFFDKFDNLKKIVKLKVPVLIMHGTKDRTIPFWHGVTLYNAAPFPKQHLWITNAGHMNIMDLAGNVYWQTINDFVIRISHNNAISCNFLATPKNNN